MAKRSSAIAFAAAVCIAGAAEAQDTPSSINEPPRGPDTEQPPQPQTFTGQVRPGWEAGAEVGGGIGVGIGARAGYSYPSGLYVGGSLMHFFGPSVATLMGADNESLTLFGGDFGYKFFPRPDVELRPFIFAGIGIFNRLNEADHMVDQSTEFTIWPAFLAAYHFGNAFFFGETRLQVAPTPINFALLGGIGVGI